MRGMPIVGPPFYTVKLKREYTHGDPLYIVPTSTHYIYIKSYTDLHNNISFGIHSRRRLNGLQTMDTIIFFYHHNTRRRIIIDIRLPVIIHFSANVLYRIIFS